MKDQHSDASRPPAAMSYQELAQLGKATSAYEQADTSMKAAMELGGMALAAIGVNVLTGFNIQPHELQVVVSSTLGSVTAVSGLNIHKHAKARKAASNEINKLSHGRSS